MQVNSKESNGDPPLRRGKGYIYIYIYIYIIIAEIIDELKGEQGKEERL